MTTLNMASGLSNCATASRPLSEKKTKKKKIYRQRYPSHNLHIFSYIPEENKAILKVKKVILGKKRRYTVHRLIFRLFFFPKRTASHSLKTMNCVTFAAD